ncbi:Fe-S cluster assembly ATPase SufC [bacterium]|nr:Fe-S cluster assembly ATPase SufC [bacterium]
MTKTDDLLQIRNLSVALETKKVLHDIDLTLGVGQTLVLLGPNGAGKSTLANTIAGIDRYQLTQGEINFCGQVINDWSLTRRAQAGLMMTWQNPPSLPGVLTSNFLRQAYEKTGQEKLTIFEFQQKLNKFCEQLHLPITMMSRDFGVGFSGGEKKKLELLQLLLLRPQVAIVDELDAGLDTDAVKLVSQNLRAFQKETQAGLIIITHTAQILAHWPIDDVLVLYQGHIAATGGQELIARIQKDGYSWLKEEDD